MSAFSSPLIWVNWPATSLTLAVGLMLHMYLTGKQNGQGSGRMAMLVFRAFAVVAVLAASLAFASAPACGDTGRTGTRAAAWPLIYGWPVLAVGGLALLCDLYQKAGLPFGQALIPTGIAFALGAVGLVAEWYWSLVAVEEYCAGDSATKNVQWLTAILVSAVVALALGMKNARARA